ncbi:hypothetical protein Ahy_B02g058891 [Arachis hypogaea]|uniref:Uncharacterized protein n=1 Tax=Arachis hypogaea TaxID=3818 RepID=A0A445AFN0_ARAHY|nr:hypothetical protein Ahy_B02g058891 [Arachis hypogaea]
MWKVPLYEKSYSQPSMELVVLDKEGKVFVLANFTIDSKSLKFKPTKHNMGIIFKRDTLVSTAEDIDIPIESFGFVQTKEILSLVRDNLFLIGVMTITNTNYTTWLMMNADLEVVKKFCQKFCIQVWVVNDSDTATFVLFENSASKFLGLSAADIRSDMLAKGYGRDHFLGELNALIGKTLLFKLTVRHDNLNKFQACVITVSRICSDPEIMASLALENNINLVPYFD